VRRGISGRSFRNDVEARHRDVPQKNAEGKIRSCKECDKVRKFQRGDKWDKPEKEGYGPTK